MLNDITLNKSGYGLALGLSPESKTRANKKGKQNEKTD